MLPLIATQNRLGMFLIPLYIVSWLIRYNLNKLAKLHTSQQQISLIDCWGIADLLFSETANQELAFAHVDK